MQLIALDLNTNFTKTAVFCEVRHKSELNLIILAPLLERYFYTQKQFIPNVVGNEHGGRRKDISMEVSIEGLESLMAKLRRLGGSVDASIDKGIGKGVQKIKRDAKVNCPYDT